MKTVRVLSQQGFSLVELMVVVAIIAILSAIAIPNFQRYQQKARQSEAKNNLAAYYSANKASYAEFGRYAGNFVAIGFRPEGSLKYRVTSLDGTAGWPAAQQPTPNATGCVSTAATCNFTGGSWTWNEDTRYVTGNPNGSCVLDNTNNTFRACAGGDIAGNGTVDTWSMDHNKLLTNTTPGLN